MICLRHISEERVGVSVGAYITIECTCGPTKKGGERDRAMVVEIEKGDRSAKSCLGIVSRGDNSRASPQAPVKTPHGTPWALASQATNKKLWSTQKD